MRKTTAAALGLLFCAGVLTAKTISVYHTSDVHGWYSSRPAKWDKENSTRTIGGFAALSSLLKKEKNPYILLDSGDMFQGTPEGNSTKGMASITLMNQLGYSAGLIGNHEYDYAEDNVKVLASSASFPILGANVYAKSTGKHADYLKPYVMIEKAGTRIAVLGIAGKHTAHSTLPFNVKGLKFMDEAKETVKWMTEIKGQKPDAVIILAHIGLAGGYGNNIVDISTLTLTDVQAGQGTLKIARSAKGAALVFGGHNHTGLAKGYYDGKSGVWLAESFWSLLDVTKAELDFDDATGKFKGARVSIIPLWTDQTGEDPEVEKTIQGFSASISAEMDKVLCESEAYLGISETGLDSAIGNWMTDAMRRQAQADIAFQNTTGIRSDIKKGVVKMRDIYQVMPFDNTAVKLEMTAAQIVRLIKDNFGNGRTRLQVSGLTVKLKLSPEGNPVEISLERDGKKVPPGTSFSVVTNNYVTSGGSGGQVFGEGRNIEDTLMPIRDLLIKDVRENSPIQLPAGGRFVITN